MKTDSKEITQTKIEEHKSFIELIRFLEGESGVPLSLQTIKKNSKVEDEDRVVINPILRNILQHVKAISEAGKNLQGNDLLADVSKFKVHLEQLNASCKQLAGSGCFCTSKEVNGFKTKVKTIIGYDKYFQALRHVEVGNSIANKAKQQQINEVKAAVPPPGVPSGPAQLNRESLYYSKSARPDNQRQLYLSLGLMLNPAKALQLLPKIQNNEWIYGRMYEEGLIFDKNLQTARKYYEKGVSKGQAECQYRLGSLIQKDLQNSRQFEQEYDYIELMEDAAKQGHLQAITDLGFIFEKGIRGPSTIDLDKAHSYYLRAVKQRFPRAMNNLASMYMSNPHIKQQKNPAALLKEACDLGYSKAFLNLAICYEKGKLVQQDRGKAMSMFRRGAQRNDQESKLFWVFNLIQQNSQREEDWVHAHSYCLQVISQNDQKPEGYYFLGYMYETGLGCPKEEETSFLYYLKAARLKYPAAINKVADFYHTGYGVEKNHALAYKYYKSAADLGNPQALINLAYIYEQGYEGVTSPEPKKAVQLYQQAADLGSSQAMMILFEMYQSGKNVRRNSERAGSYLSKAAGLGNPQATRALEQRRKSRR